MAAVPVSLTELAARWRTQSAHWTTCPAQTVIEKSITSAAAAEAMMAAGIADLAARLEVERDAQKALADQRLNQIAAMTQLCAQLIRTAGTNDQVSIPPAVRDWAPTAFTEWDMDCVEPGGREGPLVVTLARKSVH